MAAAPTVCRVGLAQYGGSRCHCLGVVVVAIKKDSTHSSCLVISSSSSPTSTSDLLVLNKLRLISFSANGFSLLLDRDAGKLLQSDRDGNFTLMYRHARLMIKFYRTNAPLDLLRRRIANALSTGPIQTPLASVATARSPWPRTSPCPAMAPKDSLMVSANDPLQSPLLPLSNSTRNSRISRPVGFSNLGQTCYIAASLQLLFHSPVAHTTTRKSSSQIHNNLDCLMIDAMAAVFEKLERRDTSASVLPLKTVTESLSIQFRGSEQQDAHEFIMFCLDHMSAELMLPGPTLSLPMDLEMAHCIICVKCHTRLTRVEKARDISVYLTAESNAEAPLPLATLILSSLAKEQVDHVCPECQHTVADTCHRIKRFPEMLLIHIKRFWVNNGIIGKHHQAVDIPLVLSSKSLSPERICCDGAPDANFDLRGIISHLGRGTSSGHYIYDGYDFKNSTWIRYDDALITTRVPHMPQSVQCTAYIILFVQRPE
ncbi:hypothetical protein BSLG_007339 [Batrachochytrium salamandrivorans]|nr:hypothetical protein BSLG_007339 [Batrachochytrium salamandrivorans]